MDQELVDLIQARENAIRAMDHADTDYIEAAIYDRKACELRIEAFLKHARQVEGIQTDQELLKRAESLKMYMFGTGVPLL